jgi:hypothetical protein
MKRHSQHPANDRFKASWSRLLAMGLFAAVGIEVAILLFGPSIHVPIVKYRMHVVTGSVHRIEWPASAPGVSDTATHVAPRVNNIAAVQAELPRVYPHELWMLRFENALTFELRISEAGKVAGLRIVEPGIEIGADSAMRRLGMILEFDPAELGGRKVPVTGMIRMAVEEPAPAPWRPRAGSARALPHERH